jgi:hypothetical protein
MQEGINKPGEEKFSDDPEENLRLENEFLKLKMMAESGALFGGAASLPAEIENEFLKNVMAFEQQYAEAKSKTIRELLQNPVFAPGDDLADPQFESEYERLQQLLKKNNLQVDFIAQQTDRFKYHFITGEFFEHKMDLYPMGGMTSCFIYEEFHPDHEKEIKDITNKFFEDFFNKYINDDTYYFSREIADADDTMLSRENFLKKISEAYEVIQQFDDHHFVIENIDVQLKGGENEPEGMGFSEGTVNYLLVLNDARKKKMAGQFKIYFIREWDAWNIFSLRLAGYNYPPEE